MRTERRTAKANLTSAPKGYESPEMEKLVIRKPDNPPTDNIEYIMLSKSSYI
jgi:hypothetical protein